MVCCCVLTESDLIPMFTTFGSCLMFGLEIGMLIGITVNLLFILYSSARPSVAMQWITVSSPYGKDKN